MCKETAERPDSRSDMFSSTPRYQQNNLSWYVHTETLPNCLLDWTYDTFPTFFLEKKFQPPPFEEFLEINFQFSIVSILHR
jgi:hypothetical protein